MVLNFKTHPTRNFTWILQIHPSGNCYKPFSHISQISSYLIPPPFFIICSHSKYRRFCISVDKAYDPFVDFGDIYSFNLTSISTGLSFSSMLAASSSSSFFFSGYFGEEVLKASEATYALSLCA
jgi:hypothetical protein